MARGWSPLTIFVSIQLVFSIGLLLTACMQNFDSPIQDLSYLLLQPAYHRKNTKASKHNNTPLISIALTSLHRSGCPSQKSSSLKLRNGVPRIAGTEQKTNSKMVISSRLGKKYRANMTAESSAKMIKQIRPFIAVLLSPRYADRTAIEFGCIILLDIGHNISQRSANKTQLTVY